MIELRKLNNKYDTRQGSFQALSDVNLKIAAGEIFGVIGKSGAGKSSLVRCINALERPTSGQVFIADTEINALSESALRDARRNIGMIFQHFNLLSSRTAFDNVALPLEIHGASKSEIKSRVSELLRLVELDDFHDYFPDALSGGQKQRVAIARALATKPNVLLCDEATSSLDPVTTVAILSLLKKINHELGVTIVLITHEMDVIKQVCHKVAVLHEGKLIEQGSVIDVFTAPKSEFTKSLTRASLHLELPAKIREKLKPHAFANAYPIVRLAFVGESSKVPITSQLVENFSVATNILQADLEIINESTVGFTVCQLIGDQYLQAIEYLEQQQIKVEVLGYVD